MLRSSLANDSLLAHSFFTSPEECDSWVPSFWNGAGERRQRKLMFLPQVVPESTASACSLTRVGVLRSQVTKTKNHSRQTPTVKTTPNTCSGILVVLSPVKKDGPKILFSRLRVCLFSVPTTCGSGFGQQKHTQLLVAPFTPVTRRPIPNVTQNFRPRRNQLLTNDHRKR